MPLSLQIFSVDIGIFMDYEFDRDDENNVLNRTRDKQKSQLGGRSVHLRHHPRLSQAVS